MLAPERCSLFCPSKPEAFHLEPSGHAGRGEGGVCPKPFLSPCSASGGDGYEMMGTPPPRWNGSGGVRRTRRPLPVQGPMSECVLRGCSIEYERIICEALGKHLLRARHHFECINLDRWVVGNTGLAGGDRRPSSDASHDESGGADCEECVAHLSSPCPVPNVRR
jgi:hypothetical protein